MLQQRKYHRSLLPKVRRIRSWEVAFGSWNCTQADQELTAEAVMATSAPSARTEGGQTRAALMAAFDPSAHRAGDQTWPAVLAVAEPSAQAQAGPEEQVAAGREVASC
jgi:hypothetical protein